MTDEEKRRILAQSRALLHGSGNDGVKYTEPYDNSAYDEDHVPIPDLIREPYQPGAWRRRGSSRPRPRVPTERRLDTAPPPPSIDYAALDERTRAIVDQAVESAIEQERQQNVKFAQATNELATCVLDTLSKMKADIAQLQTLLHKLGEVRMPSVDQLVDTALDRWQERQRQRLHAH
jgi:hypothetical protein